VGGHNVYRVVDGGYSIGPKQRSDGDCRWASQDDVYVCGITWSWDYFTSAQYWRQHVAVKDVIPTNKTIV